MTPTPRLLVVDDKRAVHEHVRTLLWAQALEESVDAEPTDDSASLASLEDTGAFLLGRGFEIESAYQGAQGLELARRRHGEGKPFALAIVDLLMPPGLDGVETAERLWAIDPDLQIVLCAQHFNHSWSEIAKRLPRADSYLILRKPFQKHEILQVVYALTEKWALKKQVEAANERRYRALYHDAPALFFTFSRTGRVISANDYGSRHLGYTPGTIEGVSWKTLHPQRVWSEYQEHLVTCFKNANEVHHWQGPMVRQDGEIRYVREVSRVVVDGEGESTVLSVCDDISQERRLQRMLVHQSKHDLLTGLVNRREFEQRLSETLAQDTNDHHALVLFDLDQFRVVNDAVGHEGGDELLRQVTHLVREQLESEDTAARIAGDQFMVLRPQCDEREAKALAERLREALNGFRFVNQGKSFFVGVSCGVVPFESGAVGNLTTLIEAAEVACDSAKEAGRNRVCVLGPDAEQVVVRQSETRWIGRIRDALEDERFELYHQPIVPVVPIPGYGHHYEVLLRFRNERGEIVPPGAFVPAAERFGLVREIDEWVVRETLDWLVRNPIHADNLTSVSINLSGRSIGSPEFLTFLLETLPGAPTAKLCFEVTETAAIGDLAIAVDFIEQIRALGCSFSLDDFGSGLSSFGYLKELPVDYLKIDGSLIRNVAVDEGDRAMVRSIVDVARILGKKTVAEFVEDEAILEVLRELEVDYAQGYHLGRPSPLSLLADDEVELLSAGALA